MASQYPAASKNNPSLSHLSHSAMLRASKASTRHKSNGINAAEHTGSSGAGSAHDRQWRDEQDRKILRVKKIRAYIMIAGVATACLTLIPMTAQMLKPVVAIAGHPLVVAFVVVLLVVAFALLVAKGLQQDIANMRERRRLLEQDEEILRQTYKCIRPQVLDHFVVFPVQVLQRGVPSRFVCVTDEVVEVELENVTGSDGEIDTVAAVTRLLETVVPPHMEIRVMTKGCPQTGLAAGVICEDFGPTLAETIGRLIERETVWNTDPIRYRSQFISQLPPVSPS